MTDGEFPRASYWGRFVQGCENLQIKPANLKFPDDHGHELDFTAKSAAAPVRRTRDLAFDEFAFLKKVAGVTAKITLPSPSTMHFYRYTDFADARLYADAERFFADLANIFQQEISALLRPAAAISNPTRSRSRCCATTASANR